MLAAAQEQPLAARRLFWRSPEGEALFERWVSRVYEQPYRMDAEGWQAVGVALVGAESRSDAATDAAVAQAAVHVGERLTLRAARGAHYQRYAHGELPVRHHVVYAASDRARRDGADEPSMMSVGTGTARRAYAQFLKAQRRAR